MWGIFGVCYIIMMSFVLLFLYVEYKENGKHSKGINNRIYSKDGMHVTYVYSIPHTKERVMEILSHKNVRDKLVYEIDEKSMEIGFKDSESEFHRGIGRPIRYSMHFEPKGDSCLLYLELITFFHVRSNVPMRMNAFWSVKVDAVPYDPGQLA